jgi:hypothetical protein
MKKEPLGEIIASRTLEFVNGSGAKESVEVLIGKPIQYPDGSWYCPYLIKGPRFERQFRMVGEDSMQALQLTQKTLKTELECLARDHNGSFTLFGAPDAGL